MESHEKTIKLDDFLKIEGAVESGGQAKWFIQDGQVVVNGQVETRRGKKLREDDKVKFNHQEYTVHFAQIP